MRHAISGRKFNRKSSHRKSLFVNLSNSLIRNEQIKTTLFKAKDLRPFIEKIITIGKNNNLHSKRRVFSILRDKESVKKVFSVLSKRYQKRPGGYTRIIKSGFRYGDSSPMAIIEFLNRDKDAKGLKDRERIKELDQRATNTKRQLDVNTQTWEEEINKCEMESERLKEILLESKKKLQL